MTQQQSISRYERLMNWARNRYTEGSRLVVSIGAQPSRYARIEDMAAERYLTCNRRYA